MVRLYLLGSKGLAVLQGLEKKYYASITEVIVGRDKEVLKDYSDEIIQICSLYAIKHFEYKEDFQNEEHSYSIAIGWRWIIHSDKPIIVFHDSVLPRLRGFNPLVTALINGDETIGATALLASGGYDEGPIIMQKTMEIHYPIKINQAIQQVNQLYCALAKDVFYSILHQKLRFQDQDHSKATYSLWRNDEDYRINWNWSAHRIKRFIDAVGYPYKGAYALYNGEKVRILDAELAPDVSIENRMPGKVIFKMDDTYTLVCGEGLLQIKSFFNDTLTHRLEWDHFRLKFD
jgi:methionyl-tRNA formyltransferase